MSLEHRGRVLLNFLYQKKVLTNAERMTSRKNQNLVNRFQYSLILQNSVIKELCSSNMFPFSGRFIKIREYRQASTPVNPF